MTSIALQTHPCNENRVFPVYFFHREKPVFISWDPCNENRFLPVGKKYTGKSLFWLCTDPVRDCSEDLYKKTLELAMYVAAHRVQSLAHSCVHVGKAWMPDSCVLQRSIDRSKNKQSPETR